jgi:hypothetical protein
LRVAVASVMSDDAVPEGLQLSPGRSFSLHTPTGKGLAVLGLVMEAIPGHHLCHYINRELCM